jgi:hypothetical protein
LADDAAADSDADAAADGAADAALAAADGAAALAAADGVVDATEAAADGAVEAVVPEQAAMSAGPTMRPAPATTLRVRNARRPICVGSAAGTGSLADMDTLLQCRDITERHPRRREPVMILESLLARDAKR